MPFKIHLFFVYIHTSLPPAHNIFPETTNFSNTHFKRRKKYTRLDIFSRYLVADTKLESTKNFLVMEYFLYVYLEQNMCEKGKMIFYFLFHYISHIHAKKDSFRA